MGLRPQARGGIVTGWAGWDRMTTDAPTARGYAGEAYSSRQAPVPKEMGVGQCSG